MKGSAREQALRTLYEADQRPTDIDSGDIEPGGSRAGRIVSGVRSEQGSLDAALEDVSTNWRVQREHFPDATPIADFMHALFYAWSAAKIGMAK